MKRILLIVLTCLFITAVFILTCSAQGEDQNPERDPVFEQEIYTRLSQTNTQAAEAFRQATQAMDSGDLQASQQGYQQVLALVPDFPDAYRRLSYIELSLGQFDQAIQYARQAFEIDGSSVNEVALANVLVSSQDSSYYSEGLSHAQSAARALPDDTFAQLTLLQAGVVNNSTEVIRQGATAFIRLQPDHPWAHYFAGIMAAEDGKLELAERELLIARQMGVPAQDVQTLLDEGISSGARQQRWMHRSGYSLVAWLLFPLVLLGAGGVLSRLTLASAYKFQPATIFQLSRGERLLRRIYRLVIATASLYFYVSIPFLIIVVLAAGAGIFYLFIEAGTIPVRLALFIGLAILYTLYAIVRSLFTRFQDSEPGRPMSQNEAPKLWSITREVAERLGTTPVEAIYVTPGTEVAVIEQGGFWKKVRGQGQRSLILGLAALRDMQLGHFKAILAHEYGHFSNRDTAGGNLARQVQASINQMAYRLAKSGQARWYNPAWLFVNIFLRIFLRITLGASRLQEILADRYAVMAFGVQNLVNGLSYLVHQDLVFAMQVDGEIQAAISQKRSISNLYSLPQIQEEEQVKGLEEKERQILSRSTSPYDSHPAIRDRFELLKPLENGYFAPDETDPIWDLLLKSDELQTDMTELVQKNLHQRLE